MDIKILNNIKIGLLYEKKIIKLNKNKKTLNIIKLLLKINFIKFYKINNNKIFLYLNPVNNKHGIKNLYKNSNQIFLKINMIKKLTFKKKWIFWLSTNKGLINNFEALKKNTGGLLLFKINN